MNESREKTAFAYFITIRTYATWLHGDERGSVDPLHNKIAEPMRKASQLLCSAMNLAAKETAFLLDKAMRETVLESMMQTCRYFDWKVFAIHVRTNHIHLVVQSTEVKEKVMGVLKSYATKLLKKRHSVLLPRRQFWSRHGSTRNIWKPETLFPALHYVVKEQGRPMALYYDKKFYALTDEMLYESL